MLAARVAGDEVEEDANPALLRRRNELVEVVQGAELRVHVVVVGDVVAPVGVRGGEGGGQPDAVDAQPFEVLEPRGDPGEISDAVSSS